MPTVLLKYGIRFHFYAADMNEPPHIHASGNNAKAKIWLLPVRLQHQSGFKSNDKKRILETVAEHEEEILEAWNEFAKSLS